MIKLETQTAAPQALATVTIQSVGQSPAIILTTSDAWKPSEDDWVRDDSKRKQTVSFFGGDGKACELVGAVQEANAVEIGSAYKIVAAVGLKLDRKSGSMRLAIEKVVEVWTTPVKCLWKAPGWGSEAPASAAIMDADGKIRKAS